MIGIFIALAILLGVGGTVTVADNARPGDALFGIDQAVEKLRINIARKENKNELRIKFAEERVKEIEDLVQNDGDDNTLVSTEISDSTDEVASSLSAEEQLNINTGIEVTLNLLANLQEQQGENSQIDDIVRRLNAFMVNLPSNARIEIDDDKLEIKFEDEEEDDSNEVEIKEKSKNGESKIKIRTDEGQIKIEVKNGVLEIKTKLNDSDDETSSKSSSKTKGLEEAEAEILPDKTIVEIEFNDEKITFTTSATTREAIIAAIVAKFPSLTSTQVDAVLEIETEDEDQDEEEKTEDDDDSDDDEDDESDSNSGSGNN